MEDPDESIIKLDTNAFEKVKRSALHNLETVTWLRKRKKKITSKKYQDPGNLYTPFITFLSQIEIRR